MTEPRIGDFIIGNDDIWEITDIRKEGLQVVYDLKILTDPGEFLDTYDWAEEKWERSKVKKDIYGIGLNRLRHLGQLVPKEESEKTINILFSKKLT